MTLKQEFIQLGAKTRKTNRKYKIYQNLGGEIIVTSQSLNEKWGLMYSTNNFDYAINQINTYWSKYANAIGYDKELLKDNEANTFIPLAFALDLDADSNEVQNYLWDISNDKINNLES